MILLRRTILDANKEGVPDTGSMKDLLNEIFPYLRLVEEHQRRKASELLKEDLDKILIVEPLERKKK